MMLSFLLLPVENLSAAGADVRIKDLVDESVSLANLVEGLNALGVSTRQMIDILSAIKAAGALHAEYILQ